MRGAAGRVGGPARAAGCPWTRQGLSPPGLMLCFLRGDRLPVAAGLTGTTSTPGGGDRMQRATVGGASSFSLARQGRWTMLVDTAGPGASGRGAGSLHLQARGDDRVGDAAQRVVVAAGVVADALEGLLDGDSAALGGDALGLFDDDPRVECVLQLGVELLLLLKLGRVDDVAGRHVGQHAGDGDVLAGP